MVPQPLLFTDYDAANRENWRRLVERAVDAGAIAPSAGAAWLDEQDRRGVSGTYCSVAMLFVVAGRTPGGIDP